MTFKWEQKTGPVVTLNGAKTAQPTFTAPSVTTDTVLTFQVVVSDGTNQSAPDTANITVRGGGSSQRMCTAALVVTPQTVSLAKRRKTVTVKMTVKNPGVRPIAVTVLPLTVASAGGVELRSQLVQPAGTIRPGRTKTFLSVATKLLG